MLKKLSFLKSKRQDQDLPKPDLGRIFPDFRAAKETTEASASLPEAHGDALEAAALPRPPTPGTFSSLFDHAADQAPESGFEDLDAAANADWTDLDDGEWNDLSTGWPNDAVDDARSDDPLGETLAESLPQSSSNLTPDPVPTAADLDDLEDLFEPETGDASLQENEVRDATHQSDWLYADLDTLEAQLHDTRQAPHDPNRQRRLFLAAHNLRGQADPAEHPLVNRVAASLCALLNLPGATLRADALVALHVAACRAAMTDGAEGDARSEAVCTALEDAVSAYRDRAEAA